MQETWRVTNTQRTKKWTSKHNNYIHFPGRRVHVLVWMHEVFQREINGIYCSRMSSGWDW